MVAVGNLLDLIGTMVSTSGGTNSPIIRTTRQIRLAIEEALARSTGASGRREESEEEIVGLLRAEVERVVGE